MTLIMSALFGGRTALVTGAGRGLGQHIAHLLAQEGANLALLARSRDQLDETARLVKDAGGTALVVPVDLTDRARRAEAVRTVLAEHGTVDILINNAGVTEPIGPTAEIDMAEWAASIEISLISPAELTAAALPGMLDKGWGRVVNVSSAIVATPLLLTGANAYVAGKTGLEAHTVSLAAELVDTGVLVNVYRPGAMETALLQATRGRIIELNPAMRAAFERDLSSGNVITPEVSADALLAHLREDVTGQIWHVGRTV
jgi:NAD(P)-dependent dehydrogenase (short-subunit alcohol dehydrogenase family)